jgi:coproporphyrinogen III oxidase
MKGKALSIAWADIAHTPSLKGAYVLMFRVLLLIHSCDPSIQFMVYSYIAIITLRDESCQRFRWFGGGQMMKGAMSYCLIAAPNMYM